MEYDTNWYVFTSKDTGKTKLDQLGQLEILCNDGIWNWRVEGDQEQTPAPAGQIWLGAAKYGYPQICPVKGHQAVLQGHWHTWPDELWMEQILPPGIGAVFQW